MRGRRKVRPWWRPREVPHRSGGRRKGTRKRTEDRKIVLVWQWPACVAKQISNMNELRLLWIVDFYRQWKLHKKQQCQRKKCEMWCGSFSQCLLHHVYFVLPLPSIQLQVQWNHLCPHWLWQPWVLAQLPPKQWKTDMLRWKKSGSLFYEYLTSRVATNQTSRPGAPHNVAGKN